MPRYFSFVLPLLALTVVPGRKTIATAQDVSALPACAKPAVLAAFQASGCAPNDANCLCSGPKLVPSLLGYIQDACGPAEQAEVASFGKAYCGIGVSSSSKAAVTSDVAAPGFTIPSTTTETPTTSSMDYSSPLLTAISPTASCHRTMTYSTSSTAKPTDEMQTGGVAKVGMGAGAFALAVSAMGWLFAEL